MRRKRERGDEARGEGRSELPTQRSENVIIGRVAESTLVATCWSPSSLCLFLAPSLFRTLHDKAFDVYIRVFMTVRAKRHNGLERGERAQPRSRRSHPRLLPAGSGGSSEWWQRRRRFCHPTYRFHQQSWSRSRARVRTAHHGSATLRTRAISSFFSLARALPRLSSSPFAR